MRGVREYWVVYYLVYIAFVVVFLALHRQSFTADNYIYLLAAVFGASLGVALFVAITAEVIGFMALLIPARVKQLKDQGREEGREEGREQGHEQGREQERQQWLAWYERQQTALRDGRPFTEPPPTGTQGRNGS